MEIPFKILSRHENLIEIWFRAFSHSDISKRFRSNCHMQFIQFQQELLVPFMISQFRLHARDKVLEAGIVVPIDGCGKWVVVR
jgi:hypothetical protein